MIDTKTVSEVRARTGAGIVECKKVLEEVGGDMDRACEELRKRGAAKAEKRGQRQTKAGLVYAYIHQGGQVGAMVEVQCETDFVARNDSFREFVHDVAMQVAAMNPLYLSPDSIPSEVVEKEREIVMAEFAGSSKPQEVVDRIASGKMEKFHSEVCLLNMPFIKDEDKTVDGLLRETIGKIGENMKIVRFVRFALTDSVPPAGAGEACGCP
ncbi:elongation factor Ts [Candidatus Uhrbacteria bacterium]|nr:elongation factor Ts [Candidatus Uhrbacteria bacterium]